MRKKINSLIKKFYKKGIITSFIVSYIVVLMLPIVFNCMGYGVSQKTVRNVLEEYNVNLLNKAVKSVDISLHSIKQTMLNVTLDKVFSEFQYVSYPFSPDETYRSVQIKENIQRYETANQMISEMYVYYPASDKIFGSTIVYTPESFFELLDENERYSGFKEWLKEMQVSDTAVFNNVRVTKTKEYNSEMLTFVCKSNNRRNGEPLMTAILFVDKNKVRKNIESEFENIDGIIYVFDNKGNEIIRTDENSFDLSGELIKFNKNSDKYDYLTLKDNEYLFCRHISSVNEWHYMLLMPTKASLASLYSLKNILLINILITLIFGMSLAIAFSMKNSKPIRQLLKKFVDAGDGDFIGNDVWEYINKSTDMIIQNDRDLKKSFQQYKPIIRKSVLIELLNGNAEELSESIDSLDSFGICFSYGSFMVVLFDFTHDEIFHDEKMLKTRITKEFLLLSEIECQFNKNYTAYAVEIDSGVVAVLLNIDENDESLIENIERVKGEIAAKANVLPTVAVGIKVDGIVNIKNSYFLAKDVLAYKIIRGAGSTVFAAELDKSSNHAAANVFDSNREKLIMEAIRNGNYENAVELLDAFTEELKHSTLSIEFVRCQFFSMMNIGFKVLSEIDVDYTNIFEDTNNPFDEIRKCSTIIEMSDRLKEIFKTVCQYIYECKTVAKSNVVNKIIDYIEDNYPDQNLGLTSLSETFNLSVSYLSYLFKEQTGSKFNEYLNNIRIESACKLLKDTNISINEISLKVGYSNVVSFNRAFKRICNMSPGQYRNL